MEGGDARRRLLDAWRGEIEAGAVYELIARREKDPRRSRRSSAGSPRPRAATAAASRSACGRSGSRCRTRRASASRVAPAAGPAGAGRPAARRARGRRGRGGRRSLPAADRRHRRRTACSTTSARTSAPTRRPSRSSSRAAAPRRRRARFRPRGRALDRILGRERWHAVRLGLDLRRDLRRQRRARGGVRHRRGRLGRDRRLALRAHRGLAGAVASALSMATGAYLAERSEQEVTEANVERERREIEEHPGGGEAGTLALLPAERASTSRPRSSSPSGRRPTPRRCCACWRPEEFGVTDARAAHPVEAAARGGRQHRRRRDHPGDPVLLLQRRHGRGRRAAIVSLVAHFAVGAAKSLFTLRSWWAAGLEMTLAGVVVGGVTYAVGLLFG